MTDEYVIIIERHELDPNDVWYVAQISSINICVQSRTALDALAELQRVLTARQAIAKQLDTTIFNYLPEGEDRAATDFWF